jgi:O-6-methylguanine DNA methyltransferase
MKKNSPCYTLFNSPVAPIVLISFHGRLSHLLFFQSEQALFAQVMNQIKNRSGEIPVKDNRPFEKWHAMFNRYFSGEKVIFNEPICFMNGTVLQKKIWNGLMQIPYGTVRSYQDIADQLGMAKSARVIGGACATNPIPIIIPCHRVVRHDGTLGGYRPGIEIKKRLIALERGTLR